MAAQLGLYGKVYKIELGADDYVTKPFPVSVFQKKTAALFNRITRQTGGDCYDDGNLINDFSGMTATLAGNNVMFTPLDYRLLKVFSVNPKFVLTRQILLEKLITLLLSIFKFFHAEDNSGFY